MAVNNVMIAGPMDTDAAGSKDFSQKTDRNLVMALSKITPPLEKGKPGQVSMELQLVVWTYELKFLM